MLMMVGDFFKINTDSLQLLPDPPPKNTCLIFLGEVVFFWVKFNVFPHHWGCGNRGKGFVAKQFLDFFRTKTVGFFTTKRVFFENLCVSPLPNNSHFPLQMTRNFCQVPYTKYWLCRKKDPIKRHIRGKHIWVVQVKWSAVGLVSLPAVELRRQWPQVAAK